MKKLSHQQIIGIVQDIAIGNYQKRNGCKKKVHYIVLEYAQGYDLDQYVILSK